MKFKAICTDIDGTLLNKHRQLSQRTIATIQSIAQDVPVILASSRMPDAMRHLQQELNILHHPLICYNGGYVICFENNSATPIQLDSLEIPATVCQTIYGLTIGTGIHVSLFQKNSWYAPAYDYWAEREERITKVMPTITELAPVLKDWQQTSKGAHKVMCMGSAEEIDTLQQVLEKKYADKVHAYRSKDTYLEIAPRAVSKATAIELLLTKRYGIAMQEVIAFGDNYNDIDMLKAVGKGIAVGNARPEVKAVADELTAPSIEDGVAIAIKKYLL